MRRRDFFFSSAGAASPLFNTAVGAETRGPNVLLLLTRSGDDALRRLAVEGTSFTRCYTTNPARAASLASLVTGRYPHAAAKADKLAARLEAAGYAACRDDPPSVVFISTTRSRPFYVEAAGEIRPWLDALDAAKLARETLVFAATLPDETAEATPFDRSCRLPLFIRWPGHFRGGAVDDLLLSLADVAPSLLALCGVAAPEGVHGRNLSAAMMSGEGERPEAVYAYGQLSTPHEWRMVVRGLDKLVVNIKMETTHLFNLGLDPEETRNLATEAGWARLQDELKAHLREWMKRIGDGVDPSSGLKLR